MNNKLIFMAGGGTAGHINPNLALVEPLQKAGYRVEYMGQKNEMEYPLVTAAGGRGTTAARTATTGRARSTRLATLGT